MILQILVLSGILLAESLVSPPPLRPGSAPTAVLRQDDPAADWGVDEEDDLPTDDDDEDDVYEEDIAISHARLGRQEADCGGCAFTIDLSCPHHFEKRSGYWHRLADCLVPSYGLLDMARKAEGTVCILTYSNLPSLNLFLPVLIPDLLEKGARIIDYAEPCASSLTAHAVDPSVTDQVEKHYMDEFPRLQNITGRYPIDWTANVRALQRDAVKAVSSPGNTQLVLLDRPHSVSRVLAPKAKASLAGVLKGIAGAGQIGYANYDGSMNVPDTIRLFMNAAGIIGYHGAAFVNALFTTRPSCVMEITTYNDQAGTVEWRTNEWLAKEHVLLSWHKVHIQLQTLVDINEAKLVDQTLTKRNKWIKNLRYVNLLGSDLAAVDEGLKKCLTGINR